MTSISKIFLSFTNLKFLNLNKNKISKIENLHNLKNLEKLELRANQIKTIENLDNNKSLKYLTLSCNLIDNINNDSFPELPSVEEFGIFGNYLGNKENQQENQNILQNFCLLLNLKMKKLNAIYLGGNHFSHIENWETLVRNYSPMIKIIDGKSK